MYENVDVIAYSAGVFIASIFADTISNVRRKVAVCGNPYLFDEKLGISKENIQAFRKITLNNYLDFRRKYMVFSDEEFENYNKLESLRTIESCENELTALEQIYRKNKNKINPVFDKAIVAENDLIFDVQAQKDFIKKNCKSFEMPSIIYSFVLTVLRICWIFKDYFSVYQMC